MTPIFPQVGGTELLILLVIILLLFGAKRIPQLARSLGSGTREFRKGMAKGYDQDKAGERRAERGRGDSYTGGRAFRQA